MAVIEPVELEDLVPLRGRGTRAASRRALIVASVPEESPAAASRSTASGLGTIISASSTSPNVGAPKEKPRVAGAFFTASTT